MNKRLTIILLTVLMAVTAIAQQQRPNASQMQRKPDLKAFDAIVKSGQSIQAAIEKAPEKPTQPYKILIKKGT